MQSPRRNLYLVVASLAVLSLRASCGNKQKPPPVGNGPTSEELSRGEAEKFRKEVTSFYAPYKSLSVGFTLKGKVSNEELFYEGDLSSSAASLKLGLKDAVFLSPLITLDIGKEKVSLRDHARAKVESIPRSEYQWVELFGRTFPVRFFEPLMRGMLPEDAVAKDSVYARTGAGEVLVRSNNDSFEAAMYFSGTQLVKIFYRDKIRGEILIFHIGAFFKKGNYPQTLKIEHSRANDYLTLAFKGLRVTK